MQKDEKRWNWIQPSNKMNLVFWYRYASLVLTSLFYLLGPQSPFIFKVVVVVSLGFAAWIVTDLQKKYMENSSVLKLIVLTETAGLTLLLIPTGGISSPFIWYALNPVIIAAGFLTLKFCWATLAFYLSSATFIAYRLFQVDSLIALVSDKSYFYLVCILTTILTRLFSGLTKELTQVNRQLTDTNKKYEETLEQVMSLYYLMENFADEKSPKMLTREITSSLTKCTQSESAFFWLTDINHANDHLELVGVGEGFETELRVKWPRFRGKKEIFSEPVGGQRYLMKIIRTAENIGVLGIAMPMKDESLQTRTFDFLADLSEIMLERLHMDRMNDQMLIVEEQNRIANDIHDGVSQRLFGMAFALHSLEKKIRSSGGADLSKDFQLLSQSVNTAIKELRTAIYSLSSLKRSEKPFFVLIRKYLDEYAKLNDIKIDYSLSGRETPIENNLKQALYRMICEACGNAVRHGYCTHVGVELTIEDERVILSIKDNGVGFIPEKVNRKDKGLGMVNMRNLAGSYGGKLVIDSKPGAGTHIKLELPAVKTPSKQGVAG